MRYRFLLKYYRFKFFAVLIVILTCYVLINELFKQQNFQYRELFLQSSSYKFQNSQYSVGKQSTVPGLPPFFTNHTNFIPGLFLKGMYPTNQSYCKFNYGAPYNFSWSEKYVSFTPQQGEKGPYRVLYNVIEQLNPLENLEKFNVTYCTHATPEFMYHIVEIVHRWDGPVSVAVFVPYTDAGLCLAVVDHLCRCLPEMSQLSLHFIFPSTLPPVVSWTSADYNETHMKSPKKPEFLDCSAPKDLFTGQFKTFRSQEGLTYPVNVARNVARRGAQTWHILVSDVELLPSEGLVPGFMSMLSRFHKKRGHYSTSTKFVFVVPVFEVDESLHNVPMTKEQLLDLYAQNKAVYFHRWVCLHCQRFPGLQRWLQRKPGVGGTSFVQPILVVRREFPYHRWEPIYIGTNQDPLYSEVLTWEGQQDKMAQMGEMCLMGYRFIILDGAFLVHTPSIKRRSDITIERTAWRRPHEKRNIKMYESVVYKLIHKYGKNNRCKI